MTKVRLYVPRYSMLSVKIEIVDSPDVWLICAKVRNSFRLYPVSEVTVEFTF